MWHVREKKEVHIRFWWGNLSEKDPLEDLGVNGTIILELIFKKWNGAMDCMGLAWRRYRWQSLVNAATNHSVQ